jgi:hypothetical protein
MDAEVCLHTSVHYTHYHLFSRSKDRANTVKEDRRAYITAHDGKYNFVPIDVPFPFSE